MIKSRVQFLPAYIGDLRQKTGLYMGWIPNEYADQMSENNFHEVLMNDAAVAHASHLYSVWCGAEYWELNVADNPLLTLVTKQALDNIHDFSHARMSMVKSSTIMGLGVQKKYWEISELADGNYWAVPKALREVDRRRLRIERDPDNKAVCRWTMYRPDLDVNGVCYYVLLEDRNETPNAELALQDFVWLVHEYEELNPYKRGLGNPLYPLVFLKSKLLQYWASLSESWSKPFLVAAIDMLKGSVDASISGQYDSATRAKKLLEMFEASRARHTCVIDASDKVTLHEAGSVGNNIIKEFCEVIDSKIQLLLLGAELTTGATAQGSFALGQIHRGATQSLIVYGRSRLEEVIVRDVIFDFFWRNRVNFYRNGWKYPKVSDVKFKLKIAAEENVKEAAAQGKKTEQGLN
jgi:hypothetical protein